MYKKTKLCEKCGKEFTAKAFTQKVCVDCKHTFCPICDQRVNNNLTEGVCCSKKCSYEKSKRTMLDRYGVDNTFKSDELKAKGRQTLLDKYGVTSPMKSPILLQRVLDTTKSRYGRTCNVDVEKSKQTMLKRYGVEHALQDQGFLDKKTETNIQKYGSAEVGQFGTESKTNLIKDLYGGWGNASPQIIQKQHKTMLERYGVEYAMQVDCFKNKLKQTNLDRYGYETNLNHYKTQNFNRISKLNISIGALFDILEEDFEFNLEGRYYDFKKNNFLIEVNPSVTHNSTANIIRPNQPALPSDYHYNKSRIAEDNGYRCIHVWDWDDLDKIKSLILPCRVCIMAQDCMVSLADANIVNQFLSRNHLQGACENPQICLGLYKENQLIQLMVFNKSKKYDWELIRLCTLEDHMVVGGYEKLLKYFIDNYKPLSIISHCDYSKSNGEDYLKLDFKKLNQSMPLRHWFNLKTKEHVVDNSSRKHSINEMVLKETFVEIYDCGQLSLIWLNKTLE